MILHQHWPIYQELAEKNLLHSPLLMLGNQSVGSPFHFTTAREMFKHLGVFTYVTLDPDGGDYPCNLNDDLGGLAGRFKTVFNLGTIEHVWDVHTAWCNALRMVQEGGSFVTLTPVQGWDGHGIHITDMHAIMAFIEGNGFRIEYTQSVVEPRGVNLVVGATKERHIAKVMDYHKPQQVYRGGRKAKAA